MLPPAPPLPALGNPVVLKTGYIPKNLTMKTRSHAKSVQKGGSVQTGCGGDDSDTDEVPVAKLNKTRSGKMESSSAAS